MKMIWRRLRNQYYQRHLRRKDLPEVIRDYLHAFHGFNFNQPIAEAEFVIFDTESTGLNVKRGDRILSISAMRLKEGRIDLSDAFHEIINPDRDIPSASAVIHEILPRMVNGKPTIEHVLPKFHRLYRVVCACGPSRMAGYELPQSGDVPPLRHSDSKHCRGYSRLGSGVAGKEDTGIDHGHDENR